MDAADRDTFLSLLFRSGVSNDQQYLRLLRAVRYESLDEQVKQCVEFCLKCYEIERGDCHRVGDWHATHTGRRFWLLDPRPDEVDPEDIAWGLGGIARFNGDTEGADVYTVAQHSVLGSYCVPYEFALHFLLHDATEAYVGDVASPVKRVMGGKYAAIESKVKDAIARRFGITWTGKAEAAVKRADNDMLVTEDYHFRPNATINHMPDGAKVGYPQRPDVWGHDEARRRFRLRLGELWSDHRGKGT